MAERWRRQPYAAVNDSALPSGGDPSSRIFQHREQQQLDGASSPVHGLLLKAVTSEAKEEPHESSSGSRSGPLGAIAAAAGVLGGVAVLACGGYVLREPIKQFLNFFIGAVEEWGVWGYVAYTLVYAGLEVFALPAIPLTMTAGAIFGQVAGTVVVQVAAIIAATIAFLISRYLARDKILSIVQKNKRFAAIDRAISQNGLKFVILLRLSPLLPLALSNYIYGLTSVDLGSYVLGSLIGMLPGTCAYVTAGHVGKAVLLEGGSMSVAPWQVATGLGASLLALAFIGQMARSAIEEADAGADGAGGWQQQRGQQLSTQAAD